MFIYKRNQVPFIERGIYNHYLYMVNPYLSVTWFPSCESYKYNNVTSSMSSKTDMRKKSCKSREIKIVSYIKRCMCQLLTHLDDKPYKWSAFLYCCVYLVSKRKPILTGSAFKLYTIFSSFFFLEKCIAKKRYWYICFQRFICLIV